MRGLQDLKRIEASITQFSTNNIYPTEPQRAALRGMYKELKAEATRLRRHHQPRPVDDQAYEKIEELLEGCIAALAPIRCLPHEILRTIFILSTPSRGWLEKDHKPDRSQPPLSVSHVCSDWRRIALNTPELWTSVSIVMKKNAITTDYGPKWLSRTGAHLPISLHFQCLRGRWLGIDLKKIAHRLKVFHLSITPTRQLCKTLLSNLQFDALEDLEIEFRGREQTRLESPDDEDEEDDEDIPPPPPDVLEPLGRAPKLASLKLKLDFPLARNLDEVRGLFPWPQLTKLEITEIHALVWPATISLCSNLRSASLHINEGHGMHDVDYEPFEDTTLPYLEELTFTVEGDFIPAMFHGLRFPNLRYLMIEQPDEITYSPHPRQWPDPDHFYASLQNLQTLDFMHPTERLPDILRHTPNLESLSIYTNCNVDNVLKALALNESSLPGKNILRNLKKLHFSHMMSRFGLDASPDKVIAMLTSRLRKNVKEGFDSLQEFDIRVKASQSDLLDRIRHVVQGDTVIKFTGSISCLDRLRGSSESDSDSSS